MTEAAAAAEGGVTRVHEADAWVDQISQANPSRGERMNVETLEWCLKALLPCFRLSPYFLFPNSTHFYYTISPSGFDGLTVFRQRGTKNTGYAWLSPATD